MQFFLFLVIIFLAEIAFGVLIYFQEAPYPNVIRDSVEATVTKKYHNNSTATTQTFDLIQEGVSRVSQSIVSHLPGFARKLWIESLSQVRISW